MNSWVKRVSARWSLVTIASVASAGERSRMRAASARRASASITDPDRDARIPEHRRDAAVGRVLEHPAAFAVLDLPADLRAELKVQPPIVDRPRAVRFHVHAVTYVVEKMLEGYVAGEQVEVAH